MELADQEHGCDGKGRCSDAVRSSQKERHTSGHQIYSRVDQHVEHIQQYLQVVQQLINIRKAK